LIFREVGGYFTWSGEAGYTQGDALACNAALKPEVIKLLRGSSSSA
jgi:hypothetical protein